MEQSSLQPTVTQRPRPPVDGQEFAAPEVVWRQLRPGLWVGRADGIHVGIIERGRHYSLTDADEHLHTGFGSLAAAQEAAAGPIPVGRASQDVMRGSSPSPSDGECKRCGGPTVHTARAFGRGWECPACGRHSRRASRTRRHTRRFTDFEGRTTTLPASPLHCTDPADLLLLIASGSAEAFTTFYDQMAPLVYGVSRKLLIDPELAEQATEEVFLQIWRDAPRYKATPGDPVQWVLATTNAAVVQRQQTARRDQQRSHRSRTLDASSR